MSLRHTRMHRETPPTPKDQAGRTLYLLSLKSRSSQAMEQILDVLKQYEDVTIEGRSTATVLFRATAETKKNIADKLKKDCVIAPPVDCRPANVKIRTAAHTPR